MVVGRPLTLVHIHLAYLGSTSKKSSAFKAIHRRIAGHKNR
jgi:hypothetical protein